MACSVSRCRLREPLSWFWAGTALGALRVVLLEFTCTEQSQVGFMILSLKPEKLRGSTVLKLGPGSPCSRVTVPRPELAGMRPRVGAVPIGSQPGAQGHPCPLGNSAACPEVEQSPHGKTRPCFSMAVPSGEALASRCLSLHFCHGHGPSPLEGWRDTAKQSTCGYFQHSWRVVGTQQALLP